MRASATAPVEAPRSSMGGLIGGEAAKLRELEDLGAGVNGSLLALATRNAVAVLETNATMGVIVAAPTAGSAGVIPAVLLSLQEVHGFSDAQLMDALKNAAVVGSIIARNATVAGAEGGCQAEIGSAAAMAASAAVELWAARLACALLLLAMLWPTCLAWCATPSAGWWKRPVRSATPALR